ncbi:MAG: YceI family protein [Pseudomonadota bacterium]
MFTPRASLRPLVASAALLLGAAQSYALDLSAVPAGTYAVDPAHGYIHFTYTHLGFSNPMLRVDDFDVALELDTEDFTKSTLEVTIDAASINSGVERFNEHLQAEDFFHTAEHPQITFVAKRIEQQPSSPAAINVIGDLKIKGITKEVLLGGRVNKADLNPINQKPTVGVSLRAIVKRSDYGLDKYVPAVADAMTVMIELEMQKQ